MKIIRLITTSLVVATLLLMSCSGEDGENGLQGIPGTDGTNCWDLNGNGMADADEDINNDNKFDALDCQGEDGSAGENGNANVEAHVFDITLFSDYDQLDLNLSNIVDSPSNYAFIFYIHRVSNDVDYSIPGPLFDNDHYTRIFIKGNSLNINFHNTDDDTGYTVGTNEYDEVTAIAIEISNTSKNAENVMADLKAAGVDTSDYNAVAAYFGLE